MAVLHTINLSKSYKQGNNRIYAVNDVTLAVEKGQFIAIMGASGSGKSTFLHLCAGFLTPDKGKIMIEDVDITSSNTEQLADIRRNKIGFVFQQFNLMPMMTARENIIIPSLLNEKKPDITYLEQLTNGLGIDDRLDHLPGELSGGQIQRVAIARALINRPSIILADEPTGNLDKATSDEIIDLFINLHKQGNTIIIVTHDPDIAKKADITYTISDGRIG